MKTQLTNELKATLSEIIISDEYSWLISDMFENATSGQVLRFIKNNIESIFENMFENNQPAITVIATLFSEQA